MQRWMSSIPVLAVVLVAGAALAEPPLAGGGTTVFLDGQKSTHSAFSFPASNLSLTRRDAFFVGNSFFRNAWITAPGSTTARDGLGPLFNTNSCQSCHVRDGRGTPPDPGEPMVSMLVRISATPADGQLPAPEIGVVPDPVYGTQLQNRAILGVPPEAHVTLGWETIRGKYPDGAGYTLRKPKLVVEDPGYGALAETLQTSIRIAPPMLGLGLLDEIPEAAVAALADPDDADGDGISGRMNRVWDAKAGAPAMGRFGWKAEQPNVRQQVASAFLGDVGVTSSLFPTPNHTSAQAEAAAAPDGGEPELSDEILDFVVFYAKHLAVPAQRAHDSPAIIEGGERFREARCDACHVETFVTEASAAFPELGEQEFHPYTDLLLHDMGEGLADDRPTFAASGREWRTAPLWGVGLVRLVNEHTFYLHDGRARSVEEAILWHGGEAAASRDAFMEMSAADRRKLVAFVKSR